MGNIPKRILYILPNADIGGAEKLTFLMMKNHTSKYVPYALFFNDGPYVDLCRQAGIPTFVLKRKLRLRNFSSIFSAVQECRELVKSEHIDLIHASMSYAQLVANLVGRLTKVPTCLYQHGPITGGLIDRLASTIFAPKMIFTNSFEAASRERKIAKKKVPIEVVYPGTDLIDQMEKVRIEQVDGISQDAIVIGMIGRLSPLKGIGFALKASASHIRAAKRERKVKFLVVGGPYRNFDENYGQELRDLAKKEGIQDDVIFTGPKMNIFSYLMRIDILINASFDESFGLTVIEAMAAAKPVIVSRVGGLKEIVEADRTGLFFTPGNVDELSTHLNTLLTDPLLREKFGKAGRESCKKRFTVDQMITTLERFYDGL